VWEKIEINIKVAVQVFHLCIFTNFKINKVLL